MRKILLVKGYNHPGAAGLISAHARFSPWLVFQNPDIALHEYLDILHDECGLDRRLLWNLKICRYLSWEGGAITFQSGNLKEKPGNLVELLKLIRSTGTAEIIIENNSGLLYGELLQQLIHLQISGIHLQLRQQTSDNYQLTNLLGELAMKIGWLRQFFDNFGMAEEFATVFKNCLTIFENRKAQRQRLGLAAAKKSGKSTVLNCLLGANYAPADLELATPNSCIYSRASDGRQHLFYEQQHLVYDSAAEVRKKLAEFGRLAEKRKDAGYALPEMKIQTASDSALLENREIADTPGPDAAGALHAQSALTTLQTCQSALFIIDYSKYLQKGEFGYLNQVKDLFSDKSCRLMLALNKIDLAFADRGAQSPIKSSDFIRTRLIGLDPDFARFPIVPISALGYANLITLSEKASKYPAIARMLEAGFGQIKNKDTTDFDDETLTAVGNLEADFRRLKRQTGIEKPGLEDIKAASGVPALIEILNSQLLTDGSGNEIQELARKAWPEIKKASGLMKDLPEANQKHFQQLLAAVLTTVKAIEELTGE